MTIKQALAGICILLIPCFLVSLLACHVVNGLQAEIALLKRKVSVHEAQVLHGDAELTRISACAVRKIHSLIDICNDHDIHVEIGAEGRYFKVPSPPVPANGRKHGKEWMEMEHANELLSAESAAFNACAEVAAHALFCLEFECDGSVCRPRKPKAPSPVKTASEVKDIRVPVSPAGQGVLNTSPAGEL